MLRSKLVQRILALTLALAVCMGALPMAGAANKDSVQYFDHSVVERSTVTLQDGSVVHVTRTTYDNNTSVTSVLENGKTTTFTNAADYQGLVRALKQPTAPATRAGLSYRYVTTKRLIGYIGPENALYATVLSAVTDALRGVNVPLALVTGLTAAIVSSNYSPVRMWVQATFTTMGVYDSTGYFLGYYKIDYAASVFLNSSCTGQVIDSESGSYESLDVIS